MKGETRATIGRALHALASAVGDLAAAVEVLGRRCPDPDNLITVDEVEWQAKLAREATNQVYVVAQQLQARKGGAA